MVLAGDLVIPEDNDKHKSLQKNDKSIELAFNLNGDL